MTYAVEVLISVLEHCLQIFSPGSIGPGKKKKKTQSKQNKNMQSNNKRKKQQVKFYVS
jgi:hypothetical protein